MGVSQVVFSPEGRILTSQFHLRLETLNKLLTVAGVTQKDGMISMPRDLRLVEMLLEDEPQLVVSQYVIKWMDGGHTYEQKVQAIKAADDAPLPEYPLADALYPFQRVDVRFLLKVRRALLADQAGLGKSATSIATVVASGQTRHTLVVCPNTLKSWWEAEIARWDPTRTPVRVVNTATREVDMILYDQSRGWLIVNWDQLHLLQETLQLYLFDWIIADEAHRIKNRETKAFKALESLHSRGMILATATPMGNEPGELWAPLHIADPDNFTSYWRFYSMYTDVETTKSWKSGGREFKKVTGIKNSIALRKDLAPRMIRHLKKDVLTQLPPKTYKTIPVDMTHEQYRMYVEMALDGITLLTDGSSLESMHAMTTMLRLRQILSTTYTLDSTDSSGKLDAVMDIVADSGEKLLVFCQFRRTVEALQQRLKKAGVGFITVWGGMDTEEVAQCVKDFQSRSDVQVALATIQAGGVGLTLTAAHTAVFVEKHYNPAYQEQAEDRIHRITQSKQVDIITINVPQSVDDLVEQILQRKVAMTEEALRPILLAHLKAVTNG
jgi:SNF2 family DNA or RNA helicase